MRRRGSLLRFSVVALLIAGLGCCSVWIGGTVILGIPQATPHLGPPSPSLNPIQRTLLVVRLLIYESALDLPAGNPSVNFQLEVQQGDTASIVVEHLREAGIVNDAALLKDYLRYRGLDISIETGFYQLNGGMTIRSLAEALQTASIRPDFITVIEGWRREEIAAALPTNLLNLTSTDFLAATSTRPTGFSFSSELPDPPTLEGFLFPDTYHLDASLSAEGLVAKMIENFETKVGPDLREGFRQRGFSLFQAVTLASIIEREAVVAEEQPLIASVFFNRLALGMKLESDPTVQFALGLNDVGGWKRSLSFDDLQVDSPYNTYRYAGLPPGPIANPGINAIRAVAFPAETTYLYFRATCDGSGRHNFAVTFEEHQQNACP